MSEGGEVPDDSDLDEEMVEDGSVHRGFRTSLRGKIIMFDGHYREREIDLFFAVNPQSDIAQNLIYSRMYANGTLVEDSPKNATIANQTDSKNATESPKEHERVI